MILLFKSLAFSLFGLVFMMIVAAVARVLFGVQFAGSWDELAIVATVAAVAGVVALGLCVMLEIEAEDYK